MKKVLLVIASYKDWRQKLFEEKISPINERYAQHHDFEYMVITNPPPLLRGNPTWWKFSIPQQMIKDGKLKDGDIITHLDADMLIAKQDTSYETKKSFSYAIDSGNTHCMGNYTITVNEWSRNMIEQIMSEERYKALGETDFWQEFREQANWYSMTGTIRHSWKSFWEMPNYGWHSSPSKHLLYSIEELNEHVEVRGTEWNATLLQEEEEHQGHLNQFLINKCPMRDVRIRHWAGGQPWRVDAWRKFIFDAHRYNYWNRKPEDEPKKYDC